MKRCLISAILVLLAFSFAEARPRGGASTPITCPFGSALADGCAQAPAGGQFLNSTFFTSSRQSGQGQYKAAGGALSNHPPTWNVAGVDYAIGAYTDDAHLIDVVANVPAGCTYSSTLFYIRCNASVDLEGYRFNDVGLYLPGAATDNIVKNNHFTMGKNVCRGGAFTGNSMVVGIPGTSSIIADSNTFDLGSECSYIASYYKGVNDPGLATQSTGTATVSGTALTYSSTPTGNVAVGQYIDCPGCTKPAQIASGSGLNWVLDTSQPSLGPFTVTTGPTEPTLNAALTAGALTGQRNAEFKYNALIQWPTLAGGSSGANIDAEFNYIEFLGCCGQHNNFIAFIPAPGSATHITMKQNFNTVVWDALSAITGTGIIDIFATSGSANTPTGYQITYDLAQNNYNTLVTNNSIPGAGGDVTAAGVRYLNQGPVAIGTPTYTMSGGVVTVTGLTGGAIAVGQYFNGCVACTLPIQITSFIGGSGGTGTYGTSNTTDTIASAVTGKSSLYPGIITDYEVVGNYLDPTGMQGPFLYSNEIPVGTRNTTGNINMLSGNACSPGTGNCP